MKEFNKIKLAQIPTPLEIVSFESKKFLLKRDDLTGCELSGNKVRKLEYLLYDAKKKRADVIFTCGGVQSNHARSVTIAAKKIGLNTKLFLWGRPSNKISGNLFLNIINGAEVKYLTKKEYDRVNDVMFEEAEKTKKLKGKNVYVIPEGGANVIGSYAYYKFISELSSQLDLSKLDGIVLAAGSGGTAAGMLTAISELRLKTKIIVVNVLYDRSSIRKRVSTLAEALTNHLRLKTQISQDSLIILDGYSSEGYKKITKDKIKLLRSVAEQTGILFDPVYTGKAFFAYYQNYLSKNSGMKYLFVHTGGLLGIFGREREYLID
jgi:D-cysteine desulfhydrase